MEGSSSLAQDTEAEATPLTFEDLFADREARIGVLEVATGEVMDLGPGWLPRWSPDSSRLVFSTPGGGIFVIALAQPTERLLVHPTGEIPIWSPDGEWIVFNDQASAAGE